jgi:hypothetical protein
MVQYFMAVWLLAVRQWMDKHYHCLVRDSWDGKSIGLLLLESYRSFLHLLLVAVPDISI